MDTLYPPMNAVVRGAFVIAAEVSDDTEAESVFVTLKHKHNAQVSLIEGYAQSNGGGLWQLRLGDKVLPADGEYEVSVTARDKAGKSVNTKTALTIDNTPPLLVLQRPSTAALVPTAATEYDVFGDVFLLVGEVYDDNGVEKLLIKAKNGAGIEKEAALTNIPQNIRLKVDTFSLQGRTEQEAQGDFYRSIYGGQQHEGKKPFSYTLTISDNAKEYKKPGDGGSGSGNSTDVYYLYDELYSPLLKKYKLSEVYAALRQRTTVARMSAGTDSSEVLKLLENPEIKIGGTGKRQGTFALNPAIDPHYSLEGYNPKAKGEPFTSLYSPTVVTVKLMQNLDSDPLAPTKEYKVYLLEYEAYQKEVGFDINNDEDIYSDVANKQLKSWIKDITPSNMDQDGGNYTAAITVDADKMGLMYDKSYVVQVR
ncbi:MAG: Ig-like domain-containing protein, partial [Treponema sp.]